MGHQLDACMRLVAAEAVRATVGVEVGVGLGLEVVQPPLLWCNQFAAASRLAVSELWLPLSVHLMPCVANSLQPLPLPLLLSAATAHQQHPLQSHCSGPPPLCNRHLLHRWRCFGHGCEARLHRG